MFPSIDSRTPFGTISFMDGERHRVYSDKRDAEAAITGLRYGAEPGENFDLRNFEGGGWHIEKSFREKSEGFY
jgi:hypothetical protein